MLRTSANVSQGYRQNLSMIYNMTDNTTSVSILKDINYRCYVNTSQEVFFFDISMMLSSWQNDRCKKMEAYELKGTITTIGWNLIRGSYHIADSTDSGESENSSFLPAFTTHHLIFATTVAMVFLRKRRPKFTHF